MRAKKPSQTAIETARQYHWRDIDFRKRERRIFQPGGLKLDFSAIGKGFAVDYIHALLRDNGVRHALVEIGGEMKASGVKPDGLPWWADLEPAPGGTNAPVRIALSGWSVATSGHYVRRRQAQGESWSHSISPETGKPVANDIESITVLHQNCMQADALATAITVMGRQAGEAFADRYRVPVRIVSKSAVSCSSMWRRYRGDDPNKRHSA